MPGLGGVIGIKVPSKPTRLRWAGAPFVRPILGMEVGVRRHMQNIRRVRNKG